MQQFRPGGFQVLPPIVKNLIIINVILALAQHAFIKFGINLSDILGLHYFTSQMFRPWQLITHMFMHGNPFNANSTIMHLFSNMFALWMFGSMLENMWGAKKFIQFYLICGIGAALCHLGVLGYEYHNIEKAFQLYQTNPTIESFTKFLNENMKMRLDPQVNQIINLHKTWSVNEGGNFAQSSIDLIHQYLNGYTDKSGHVVQGYFDQTTVGASGAVFGILFAFGYLFPNSLLYIYFLFPIKAKYFVAFYALFELYSGIRNSAGDEVAHFAHLGGMLFAFLILKYWRNNKYRPY